MGLIKPFTISSLRLATIRIVDEGTVKAFEGLMYKGLNMKYLLNLKILHSPPKSPNSGGL